MWPKDLVEGSNGFNGLFKGSNKLMRELGQKN